MTNYADIAYTANIKSVFENDLERIYNGTHHGRETENGLKMALDYLNNTDAEKLTESELRHVVRLSTYRGTETNYRNMKTR